MSFLETVIPDLAPVCVRVRNLDAHLAGLFVGKAEVVRLMSLSTAAQEPLLLVGEPGTAKSDLIVQFCELLGIRRGAGEATGTDRLQYFEFLLTPFTEPSEVFGPVKIEEYTRRQVYARNSRGMLQEASVAFLDEVFKANSAILNSLLTILNERKFYDGGQAMSVPLVALFGATNEVPTTEELAALYDRFCLRVECRNVHSREELKELVRLGSAREQVRQARIAGEPPPDDPPGNLPTLEDFRKVHRAAVKVLGHPEFAREQALFLDSFLKKVEAIRADRLARLNDRRVVKLLKLMVVSALLAGRDLARVDHELLAYVWNNPYDQEERRILHEIAVD